MSQQQQVLKERTRAISEFKYDRHMKNGKIHSVRLNAQVLMRTRGGLMKQVSANSDLTLVHADKDGIIVGHEGYTLRLPINSKKIISIS